MIAYVVLILKQLFTSYFQMNYLQTENLGRLQGIKAFLTRETLVTELITDAKAEKAGNISSLKSIY